VDFGGASTAELDREAQVDQVTPTSDEIPTSNSPLQRPRLPTSIKKLNKLLSRHQVIDIPEHELEEQFVKGSGPGGQAINKTNSSVSLIHLPTGIRVQAQPTRSRAQNRVAARHILRDRLDALRAAGQLPGWEPRVIEVQEGASVKEKTKAEEKMLAEMYSKEELRAGKVRARKLSKEKKQRRKKRALEAARAQDREVSEAEDIDPPDAPGESPR